MKRLMLLLSPCFVAYLAALTLCYLRWPDLVIGLALASGTLAILAAAGAVLYIARELRRPRKPKTGRLVIRQPRRDIVRKGG